MGTQLHDVGLQTLMFRMAQSAFAGRNAGLFTMEARLGCHILAHRFVTPKTQLVFTPVAIVAMTTRTIIFLLDMSLTQRPRTEHAFQTKIHRPNRQG